MKYQKLTHIDILKPADGSDCTNSGISSRFVKAHLLVPEGMIGQHEPIKLLGNAMDINESELDENTFILIRRVIFGLPYFHAEPFNKQGYCMFGGNFLSYSGNGFHTICQYPVPIHDRIE